MAIEKKYYVCTKTGNLYDTIEEAELSENLPVINTLPEVGEVLEYTAIVERDGQDAAIKESGEVLGKCFIRINEESLVEAVVVKITNIDFERIVFYDKLKDSEEYLWISPKDFVMSLGYYSEYIKIING